MTPRKKVKFLIFYSIKVANSLPKILSTRTNNDDFSDKSVFELSTWKKAKLKVYGVVYYILNYKV